MLPRYTGYVRLPQMEIVSATYNMTLTNADEERRHLFVLPRDCADWQSPAAALLASGP